MDEGITEYRFREHIIPMVKLLGSVMVEMDWGARLNPMNHSPLFPTVVTAIVDVFPIEVGFITVSYIYQVHLSPGAS